MKRADIVTAARGWLGTPFHHQAKLQGVGCDCIGLIAGVGDGVGATFSYPHNYGRSPDPDMLLRSIVEANVGHEIPLDHAGLGDVLLFRIYNLPQHFGVLTSDETMVHADIKQGIVEVHLGDAWRKRILRAYRFNGLEDA